MPFPHCFFFTFFLLFLSFHFLITSALGRSQNVTIEIRNDLPTKTQVQLQLGCNKSSYFFLKLGHHYTIHNLNTEDQDFECSATWLPYFTEWEAYKAKRDKGHHTVYWSIRNYGFYQSFDGSKWMLVEPWYTE